MTPPVHRAEKSRIPKGCQPDRSSVQIPIFVFHASLLQKLYQLLPKRLHTMMFRLVRDVFLHLRSCRRAHRERAVAFLPCKLPQLDLLMHPHGRGLLQLPHEIGETMRGLQSNKQMHMIGYAADAFRESTESAYRSAQIFVQTFTLGSVNQWDAVLGGKHDVVMQSEKCRWHGGVWSLASLRDAWCFRILSGGFASLYHRLIAWMPSASQIIHQTAYGWFLRCSRIAASIKSGSSFPACRSASASSWISSVSCASSSRSKNLCTAAKALDPKDATLDITSGNSRAGLFALNPKSYASFS